MHRYVRAALQIAMALTLAGCASIHQVQWMRVDGSICQTTKINPVWWTAETETDCMSDGKAIAVPTQHDDIGILGGISGILGLIVGTSL